MPPRALGMRRGPRGLVGAGSQLLSGILWARTQTQQVENAPVPSAVGIAVFETAVPRPPPAAPRQDHGVQAVNDPSVERQRRGGRYLLETGTFLTDFSSRW